MSIAGQFSSKNPTIKRILKEASELANKPSTDFHAAPLESDLFEWHFTLRGPPSPSPFDGGVYHGRIILPPAYPLKPPSFRFVTPTGRFEVNREICLSISGHHEETWQPAWGIRTALVAIRSFMDTDASGQLGGMDASDEVRRRMALQSKASRCGMCGKSNDEIMREHNESVSEGAASAAEETVPDELRLAYREDVGKQAQGESAQRAGAAPDVAVPAREVQAASSRREQAPPLPVQLPVPPVVSLTARPPVVVGQHPGGLRDHPERLPEWVDRAIWGVILALIFLVWKRFIL